MSPRFPDGVIDAVGLELYRLALSLNPGLVPASVIGRWDHDTDLQQRYREAARSVLRVVTDKAMIIPEPDETRYEWGIWWHSGDLDGIVLSKSQFGTRERAVARADSRIGEYGITSYTIVRRQHHLWNSGEVASLSTDWCKDPDTG